MTGEMTSRIALYVISLIVLVGCFALIWVSRGTEEQVWLTVGLVLGNLFRNEAGTAVAAATQRR